MPYGWFSAKKGESAILKNLGQFAASISIHACALIKLKGKVACRAQDGCFTV